MKSINVLYCIMDMEFYQSAHNLIIMSTYPDSDGDINQRDVKSADTYADQKRLRRDLGADYQIGSKQF